MPISRFGSGRASALAKGVGRRTGIDVGAAARNGGFTLGRQLVAMLAAVVLNVLYSRFLSREDLGQFNLVLALMGTASIATLPSLNSAIVKAVARGKEGFYPYALRASFAGGVAGALVLAALAYAGLPALDGVGKPALLLGAALLPFYYGLNGWESFWVGRGDFRSSSIWGAIQVVVAAIAASAVVVAAPKVTWLIAAFVGSTAALNAILALGTLKSANEEKGEVRELLLLGFNLSWINFLPTISQYVEKIIIGIFLGPAQLAAFVIAALMPDALKNVMNTVLGTFTPKIAANTAEETMKVVRRNGLFIWGAGLASAVVAIAAAPWVIPFVFGSQYADSVRIAQVLGLLLLVQPIHNVLHTVVLFEGKVAFNTAITTIPTLARFALYPFALPTYGLVGYAFCLIFGDVFFVALAAILLKRRQATA